MDRSVQITFREQVAALCGTKVRCESWSIRGRARDRGEDQIAESFRNMTYNLQSVIKQLNYNPVNYKIPSPFLRTGILISLGKN